MANCLIFHAFMILLECTQKKLYDKIEDKGKRKENKVKYVYICNAK